MVSRRKKVVCVIGFLAAGPLVLPSHGQQAATKAGRSAGEESARPVKVVQITGLVGVKNKTSGWLSVEGGTLKFTHEQMKVDLAAAALSDVVTGNDSQRLIHGTLGTLTLFAPYESGRFLSLFRTKLDTLTIQYHDAEDGLHGAVFTMPAGKAEMFKEQLMAHGAHTSIPTEPDSGKSTPNGKGEKP